MQKPIPKGMGFLRLYYKGQIEADLAKNPGAASLLTPRLVQAAAERAYASDLQKAAERDKRVGILIQQIETVLGVDLDHVVRAAVADALEGELNKIEKEEEAHASKFETIDALRLAMVESFGEDRGVNQMCSDVGPLFVLIAFWLIAAVFAPFVLRPLPLAYICVILLFLVFLTLCWRSVHKHHKLREQMRKSLAAQILERRKGLPDRLRMLAEIPDGDPFTRLIRIESDKEG
jgi:hypothetical protein